MATFDAATGTYVLPAAPPSKATYWFHYGGDKKHQAVGSSSVTVSTYPTVGRPAVRSSSRFRAGHRVKVSGHWYRQTPSRMRVLVYRKVNGKWSRSKTVGASFRRTSATSGTYSASFKTGKRGAYRVVVIPNYGAPSDACSRSRYFRVR